MLELEKSIQMDRYRRRLCMFYVLNGSVIDLKNTTYYLLLH